MLARTRSDTARDAAARRERTRRTGGRVIIPPARASIARIGFFSLLPGAAVAGGLALAPVLGLAGAISLRPSLLRDAWARRPIWLMLTAAFVVWAVASSLWLSAGDHSQAPKLALTVLTGLLFTAAAGGDSPTRRLTRSTGAAALAVLTFMLAIEAFAWLPMNRAANPDVIDWVLERNPGRGATVLVALVWGVAGALMMRASPARIMLAALAFAACGVLAAQFGHLANAVAFMVGVAAFAFGYAAPRLAILCITGVLTVWLLVAPFAAPWLLSDPNLSAALPYSWASRVEAWLYVSAHIFDAPVFGHGLDASRAIDETIILQGVETPVVPAHPHSGSLQIWYETGAIGAGLAAGALVLGGFALARAFARNRAAAAATCGALAALGLIANVSYSLWQEWWQAAVFAGAALIAGLARDEA